MCCDVPEEYRNEHGARGGGGGDNSGQSVVSGCVERAYQAGISIGVSCVVLG